jgi:uncharacterized protein with NRDE domain
MSVIRTPGDALRIAFNRDELLTRPPAIPPALSRFGERDAVMPIDPRSGGTWIGANDAGVVLALLNLNESPRPASAGRMSRGVIIPRLIGASAVSEAIELCIELRLRDFGPFRLVALDRRGEFSQVRFDGRDLRCESNRLDRPIMFTSSGLGDALVDAPRRTLFAKVHSDATQDAFHRHFWPDRSHVSVCMSRPDARTVSYTVVTLSARRVTMIYHGASPNVAVGCTAQELSLREAVAA